MLNLYTTTTTTTTTTFMTEFSFSATLLTSIFYSSLQCTFALSNIDVNHARIRTARTVAMTAVKRNNLLNSGCDFSQ